MKFLFTTFLLVSTAALGFANKLDPVKTPKLPPQIPTEDPITLISQLSPECQGAFLSIVTNPEFFECVPVVSLLPLLTDPTLLPSVIQDPVKNGPKLLPIVDAICADPKCSDESVAAALKAVEEGCKADAKNPLVKLATSVLTFYSPGRDIICFKDNKDQYCLVDTLTTVFTLPTPPPDFKLFGGIIDKLITAEPKFICTPCDKAIVNTLVNFFKKDPEALEILDQAFNIGAAELKIGELYFTLKCGFQFLDGKVPKTTIDPAKFTYQVKDGEGSAATRMELSLVTIGSLLASGLILN